jgi:hypothetical protein
MRMDSHLEIDYQALNVSSRFLTQASDDLDGAAKTRQGFPDVVS